MSVLLATVALALAVITAQPIEDQAVTKLDGEGPRYQYMVTPEGEELVDLWVTESEIAAAAFNPEQDNGYHIFTRQNPTTSQPIPLGHDGALRNSNYDTNKKTVVLIHGWKNVPTSDFNVNMVHAYLVAEDVNVLMVDWSIGADLSYALSILYIVESGEHVAKYISWLIDSSGGDISRYHVIGHSLGAHQAGIVGRHLGGRLPYVTALDPALPGFILNSHAVSPDVAVYTEVIHTDAALQGVLMAAGDVDFYPNGGSGMPGCDSSNCNHHRCLFYMAESLISGGFMGRRCDSLTSALAGNCVEPDFLRMGGPTPKTGSSGIYHLTTNAAPPFSQW